MIVWVIPWPPCRRHAESHESFLQAYRLELLLVTVFFSWVLCWLINNSGAALFACSTGVLFDGCLVVGSAQPSELVLLFLFVCHVVGSGRHLDDCNSHAIMFLELYIVKGTGNMLGKIKPEDTRQQFYQRSSVTNLLFVAPSVSHWMLS